MLITTRNKWKYNGDCQETSMRIYLPFGNGLSAVTLFIPSSCHTICSPCSRGTGFWHFWLQENLIWLTRNAKKSPKTWTIHRRIHCNGKISAWYVDWTVLSHFEKTRGLVWERGKNKALFLALKHCSSGQLQHKAALLAADCKTLTRVVGNQFLPEGAYRKGTADKAL